MRSFTSEAAAWNNSHNAAQRATDKTALGSWVLSYDPEIVLEGAYYWSVGSTFVLELADGATITYRDLIGLPPA